jgi:hypothetical protein
VLYSIKMIMRKQGLYLTLYLWHLTQTPSMLDRKDEWSRI